MVRSIRLLILPFLFLLAISCQKDEVKSPSGQVTFSFNNKSALSSGRTASVTASYLVVSATDASGTKIYDHKKIELFTFGTQYLSEPVEFKTGSYNLTEFLVTDKNDSILYATPLEGSKLAYLVQDPLPINFTVTKDQVTEVVPDVVAVSESTKAEDFGYAAFSFSVVPTFGFQLAVFVYDGTSKNFELTSSAVSITANGNTYYNNTLSDSTHYIVLKSDAASYTISVSKSNYQTYSATFSASALQQYTGSSVLKVILLDNSLNVGLVAYYPFTGNALDMSGNNLNGVVHGATLIADRKGTPNAAYSFDGVSNYISVANNNLLNLTGDFSLSLWTQVDPAQVINSNNLTINTIIRKWNGTAEGYPFGISYLNSTNPDKNKFIMVRYDGASCYNVPSLYSAEITDFSYTHLALVKQGNKLRQYINGILIQEITDTTICSTSNTADMTIGCLGNLLRFFKGSIDDIRIYNRALTDSEVSALKAE